MRQNVGDESTLEDGEICDVCGEPVFFYEETETDCPNCGQTYKLDEGL